MIDGRIDTMFLVIPRAILRCRTLCMKVEPIRLNAIGRSLKAV